LKLPIWSDTAWSESRGYRGKKDNKEIANLEKRTLRMERINPSFIQVPLLFIASENQFISKIQVVKLFS